MQRLRQLVEHCRSRPSNWFLYSNRCRYFSNRFLHQPWFLESRRLLAELGSCFDVASVSETQAVLAAGAVPERISYGNTIKKESEIRAAAALGVALFAVDCEAEVEKVARCAPDEGARL